MSSNIRLIVFVIASLILSCESKSQKASDAPIKTDSVQTAANTSSRIDSLAAEPLVTFIELGSDKCIPCKMMQPIIEEIKEEYKGRVEVVFHDVWTAQGKPYAEKYGIRAIPTQIFLDQNGEEFFRHTGFFPKEELVEVLKKQGVK